MIKLSPRLKAISDFVGDDYSIVDVGCDHAYLSIYLYQNKKNINIIASDINHNALAIAKKNISLHKLDSKINTILSDGLKNIDVSEIDAIIISGMGGRSIIKILKDTDLKSIKQVIVQANTDIVLVRKSIIKMGFYIEDETMIMDNNKYYTVINFKKGKRIYTKKELYFGPKLLCKKEEIFLNKCNSDLEKLQNIFKNIPWTKLIKKISIYLKIRLYRL